MASGTRMSSSCSRSRSSSTSFNGRDCFVFCDSSRRSRQRNRAAGGGGFGRRFRRARRGIHQSKGLEFPVVVVADLGKPFNLSDACARKINSRCALRTLPADQAAAHGQRYPSLPYWLARQRQKQEMLGVELRLLYVAARRDRAICSFNKATSLKKVSQAMVRANEFHDSIGARRAELSRLDCRVVGPNRKQPGGKRRKFLSGRKYLVALAHLR